MEELGEQCTDRIREARHNVLSIKHVLDTEYGGGLVAGAPHINLLEARPDDPDEVCPEAQVAPSLFRHPRPVLVIRGHFDGEVGSKLQRLEVFRRGSRGDTIRADKGDIGR